MDCYDAQRRRIALSQAWVGPVHAWDETAGQPKAFEPPPAPSPGIFEPGDIPAAMRSVRSDGGGPGDHCLLESDQQRAGHSD